MECFFCGEPLEPVGPGELPESHRLAFDPHLGRLWQVCAACLRWTPVPIEERWETLEACEATAHNRGRTLLETEHLSLIALPRGQLVRVGEALRLELADWRYSNRLDAFPVRRPGLLRRLLLSIPEGGPAGATYHGTQRFPGAEWITSPFQEHGGLLRALFLAVPLAERCPACEGPLALLPVDFGRLRLLTEGGELALAARCALCGEISALGLRDARPALRAGLAIVNRREREPRLVEVSVLRLEGGRDRFLRRLAGEGAQLAELSVAERVALGIGLDEDAEAEALEEEWRRAEELAAITDEELTEVPGFAEFRERVLAGEAP